MILYYERADVVFRICSGSARRVTFSNEITLLSLDLLFTKKHYLV